MSCEKNRDLPNNICHKDLLLIIWPWFVANNMTLTTWFMCFSLNIHTQHNVVGKLVSWLVSCHLSYPLWAPSWCMLWSSMTPTTSTMYITCYMAIWHWLYRSDIGYLRHEFLFWSHSWWYPLFMTIMALGSSLILFNMLSTITQLYK